MTIAPRDNISNDKYYFIFFYFYIIKFVIFGFLAFIHVIQTFHEKENPSNFTITF